MTKQNLNSKSKKNTFNGANIEKNNISCNKYEKIINITD